MSLSLSPIEQLIDCQGALIRALDDGDVSAVERATTLVARALDAVRGESITDASDRGRFDYALRQTEAARGRVNFLTDRVANRLERLTQRRGQPVVQIYTARGKLGNNLTV